MLMLCAIFVFIVVVSIFINSVAVFRCDYLCRMDFSNNYHRFRIARTLREHTSNRNQMAQFSIFYLVIGIGILDFVAIVRCWQLVLVRTASMVTNRMVDGSKGPMGMKPKQRNDFYEDIDGQLFG